MQRGRFITFEGGEGAGKSTQLRRLADWLDARGEAVVATREPGGSPGAEALRSLLVEGEPDRWSPVSETLLLYAAREDHLERLIRPALARGAWVLCDRFADSTRAYQAAGGGAPLALIEALEAAVLGDVRPDLTLILDLPADLGLARVVRRAGLEARFERMDHSFHERLRQGFLDIAAREPERCVVIDGAANLDAVAGRVRATVEARFGVPA